MSASRTPPDGGPSIRSLGDDPHRVVAGFFGHLEKVAGAAPRQGETPMPPAGGPKPARPGKPGARATRR